MSENLLEIVQNLFTIIDEVKREQKENPKEGNLFLLGAFRHTYENSHSDIIANLLDPKDSHKHGDAFLRMFLRHIGLTELGKIKDLSSTCIARENQRIDILLKHEDFIIIIENKIDSGDQPKQLSRYYDKIPEHKDKVHVVYLTPDGGEPTEESTENRDEINEKLICISYKNHIIKWLEDIYAKLYYDAEPLLKSGVEQYLYAVKVITNQLEEDNTMKDKLFQELIKMDQYDDLQNLFESVIMARDLYPIFKIYEYFAKNKNNIEDLYFTDEIEKKSIEDLLNYLPQSPISLHIELTKIKITFYKRKEENAHYRLEVSGLSSFGDEVRKKIQELLPNQVGRESVADKNIFDAWQYSPHVTSKKNIDETIARIEKLIEYFLELEN